MKITGSEAIIQCLRHEGVQTIFGYPGGAIMPAYDALLDFSSHIRHVLVRHEQGAAHAAEGYARVTGRAGVCIVTSGPGATNLVTGIADAMLDSVPLVAITGQVVSTYLGTDAFQETDVMGITMPITKWNYQVSTPEEIPLAFAKAFYIAQNGRPGPVVLDITKDAQIGSLEFHYNKVTELENFDPKPALDAEAIEAAAVLINDAKRPLLLVGHGVSIAGAQRELIDLAEKSGIPISCTLHGLSCVPSAHPLHVGMLGMHGNYGPNLLTNEADLLIAVGMRFDDRVTGDVKHYAEKARIIHIDVDPAEIDKNIKVTIPLIADAKDAVQALLPLVKKNSHAEWLSEFNRCMEIEKAKVIDNDLHPKDGLIKMSEVIRTLSDKSNGEAIVVSDVGQNQMMAARYYRFKRPDSYITSGGLGTMGFAIPAAMGAKFAAPDRQVVAICGDGGFQMTMQELVTIVQEELPVKIIVLQNNFLGMVRQWQELFFDKRYSATPLTNPDFVRLADACGIPGERVNERADLDGALERLLAAKGPYLLDIVVQKEDNVFPMVPAGASVSSIRLE